MTYILTALRIIKRWQNFK